MQRNKSVQTRYLYATNIFFWGGGLHPQSVVLVGVQANKQTTTTTTIIHFIITFVGRYEDFHVPTNVISPCKHISYYICGKSRVTFVHCKKGYENVATSAHFPESDQLK